MPPEVPSRSGALALGELEAATGAATAVLLALLDARVAREEAGLAELAVCVRLHQEHGAGDGERGRVGLARGAAALDGNGEVVLLRNAGDVERPQRRGAVRAEE